MSEVDIEQMIKDKYTKICICKSISKATMKKADERYASIDLLLADLIRARAELNGSAKEEKPAEKKPVEKPAEKPVEKPAEKLKASEAKPVEKPAGGDSQRAAAILAGKHVEAAANGGGQFVILIGAFSNPANVKQLQTKIGELGIKVFTESLDSPEGKKTRVRAGPFPNREAAEKAAEKIKRIGVNGVVAAKP